MSIPTPSAGTAALVTGASSGIGEELAVRLAQRGHRVILVARRPQQLQRVADRIGDGAVVLPCDLTDHAARQRLFEDVRALGLHVDVLVNNAGMATMGPAHSADVESELRIVELDVAAVVDLCVRFLPAMVARGAGCVLNVASTGAFQPLPGQAGYGASKAFVLSYTRSLVGELRGTGVTATVLCPGAVDTGFGERAGFAKEDAEAALPAFMWKSPEFVAEAAIEALEHGRTVAIPGIANRVGRVLTGLVPDRVLIPLLSRMNPSLRK